MPGERVADLDGTEQRVGRPGVAGLWAVGAWLAAPKGGGSVPPSMGVRLHGCSRASSIAGAVRGLLSRQTHRGSWRADRRRAGGAAGRYRGRGDRGAWAGSVGETRCRDCVWRRGQARSAGGDRTSRSSHTGHRGRRGRSGGLGAAEERARLFGGARQPSAAVTALDVKVHSTPNPVGGFRHFYTPRPSPGLARKCPKCFSEPGRARARQSSVLKPRDANRGSCLVLLCVCGRTLWRDRAGVRNKLCPCRQDADS